METHSSTTQPNRQDILNPERWNLAISKPFDTLLIRIVSSSMTYTGVTPSDTVACHLSVHSRGLIFMSGWWFSCSRPHEEIQWMDTVNYSHLTLLGEPTTMPLMAVCTVIQVCVCVGVSFQHLTRLDVIISIWSPIQTKQSGKVSGLIYSPW